MLYGFGPQHAPWAWDGPPFLVRGLSDGPPGVPTCVMKWAVDGPVGWKAQRAPGTWTRSACSAVRPHKERPQSIFPPFVDWHGLVLSSSSSTPQKKNLLLLLP